MKECSILPPKQKEKLFFDTFQQIGLDKMLCFLHL